ncbi:MAG: polysaccharide biosynthesis protein [Hellea sp.]|nr:polysaccharide biosynthesis protein [Hellea sp.]
MLSGLKSFLNLPGVSKFMVILYDALLGGLCMYLVIQWRYTFEDVPTPAGVAESATAVFIISCICAWILTDAHKAIWRFISLDDFKRLFQAVALSIIITPVILFFFFARAEGFPRLASFVVGPLFFFALVMSRVLVLFVQNGDIRAIFRGQNSNLPNAVLIGTQQSLHIYLRDASRKAAGPGYNIKGLIGTDADHRGRSIRGIPVLGNLDELSSVYSGLKNRYDRPPTLIATDVNPGRTKSYDLVRKASELGAPLVRVSQTRPDTLSPFEASDLIGRELRALDIEPVRRFIAGKRVMITGAGGTIGSEITRQVTAYMPERLILVDNSEYNLYEIDRELRSSTPDAHRNWFPFLANICDIPRMEEIFVAEKPEIIIHAAALKHVPLSEVNPIEALRTNIGGTRNILSLANKYKAESFTLISTDKAVRPTNIMGASKRIAEMLTMGQTGKSPKMSTCAVRFGNVLASTGSVVPLFEEQIAKGGPVTVTHKDVTRYFMTTEEAAALVLQAAALNSNQRPELGSIYVLEMGEPVKINKLARQLIRLRGLVPDRDIQIIYTGLRPGEKLTEELIYDEELLESTYVDGVLRFTGAMSAPEVTKGFIDTLLKYVVLRDRKEIKKSLAKLLPDYKPNGSLNQKQKPKDHAQPKPKSETI